MMEVDERLRWLESRVNSSLRPKGEKLRTFFADSDNRLRFLDFCNNSETRHLFVHLPTESEESTGTCTLRVSPHPPDSIHTKALFFIKNTHTSRLNKETIGNEVVCSECSEDPMEHLELVLREVYLPLLAEQKEGAAASSAASAQGISPERIMDILHRMISNIQVTQGHLSGDLVLPIPSLDILVEGAASGNNERRAVVVHIMESCVISWMKQVKMAMHFDPNGAIAKSSGKMAGPMAEIKYWENRYQQLLLVRSQLNSVEVLRILNGLEHARSTYADAFIDVHRDMEKSIIDTELALMYVNTLKPLFLKLEGAFSPDTLTDLFPSLVTTLSLVWQHSKVYAQSVHFSRLLRLISNKLALKAKDIVGVDPLENPIESCVCIRQALRICSAFRGYYLDRRDVAERVIGQNKDRLNQIQQESIHQTRSKESTFDQDSTVGDSSIISFSRQGHHSIDYPLCSWPPRNSPVFTSLNSTLERCNDLLELVQTMEHFSELALVAAQGSSEGKDPILIDVYHQFQATLDHFRKSTKDLMSLEQVGFEKSFFVFRSSVKELEGQLSQVLFCYFDDCLLLEPSLRLLESFQGLISRESIQSVLSPKLDAIIDTIQADVTQIKDCLTSFVTDPPLIPNTPATPSKLLWLRALRERMDVPIERVREAAPYLLHGEKGFLLRHAHNKIIKAIEQQWNSVVSSWKKSLPESIDNALLCTLLKQDESSGELQVNFSLSLEKVLRELHYMKGPLLLVPVPQVINSLSVTLSPHTLHQYRVSLEVYMRQYNSMQETLDTVHKALFQQKLSLLDKYLEEGLGQLNWLSVEVPDFLAKLKASLQTDLLPAVQCVLQQTERIRNITGSWTSLVTLDMFRDTERSSLDLLADMYRESVETAERVLCSSMIQIEGLFKKAYQRVEVSWDSPAWSGYLYYLDCLVVKGLKQMILHSMNTLISRAQKYEQGGSIPPMVTVSLELYEKDIEFSPPLSSRSSLRSVPERIKQYLEGFVSLSKSLHSRLYPLSTESYYQLMSSDPEVLGNLQKITAHVETSARQCQSLRKRFSQYSFLWEQDVLATFDDFINGVGQPHPRRFTRPETVNKSRSASARSRGHSAAPPPMSSQTASSVLESVTGHSDWEFLKPDRQYSAPSSSSPSNTPPSTSRSSSSSETGLIKDGRKPRHPTLEDFDGEIAVFQGVLERLSGSIDTVDVGWICVDQRAVKNALTSLAKKWTYIYANYLEKKVLLVLRELEVFFTEIEPQVEAISGDTVDPDHIMTLVTIFNKVNLQQLVMDGKFGAVHRAVSILDKFNQILPAQTRDHFEGIPHRWSSLKKRLALSKQRIAPLIQSHSAAIKRDLEVFGSEAQRQHQSFLSSPCLSHNCDPPVAQDLIKEYVQILLGLRAQAKDLMELQELLQASIVNFSILNQFEDELTNANLLWERQHMISEYHTNIKTQIWLNVDFSNMKDTCLEHTELLMSLGDCTGDWDARAYFQEAVYEMQHTVPLLEGLSNKHMRPRHWKQVLRYSSNHSLILLLMKNGTLDMNVLRHMTVGRFMELKLLSFSADILGIVDRASKEVAIEELLKNLEEVWLSMQFQLKPFYRLHGHEQAVSDIGVEAGRISALSHASPVVRKRSVSSGRVSIISVTPTVAIERMTHHHHHQQEVVMLLDDVDKIFEALDHYQTSLKSLEGSLAATSFSEELQHWHKQLQTVEAVLRVWLQVQTHWVQLEEVLTSIEAAQHLPSTHFNFITINKEWKQLLKSTAKSPNVIQCCLQEDLLQMLEKFLNTLTQCQSVLLQYVQCKSSRCPWLYFLTLEDVLQLVCYSSNVPVLCKVIPKLFLHSTGLQFSNDISLLPLIRSSSLLPRITGLTGYGREKLELAEAIQEWLTKKDHGQVVGYTESCNGPRCNPLCPEDIILGQLGPVWGSNIQLGVCLIVVMVTVLSLCVKISFFVWYKVLQKRQRRVIRTEEVDPNKGLESNLPICEDRDAISVSCLNLRYSVTLSKSALKKRSGTDALNAQRVKRLMSVSAVVNASCVGGGGAKGRGRYRGRSGAGPADPEAPHELEEIESVECAENNDMLGSLQEFQKRHEGKQRRTGKLKRYLSERTINSNKDRKKKEIIRGISAYFNPGEMIAVMGPSGCGKTTFIDLLAGRQNLGSYQGSIIVNGCPIERVRDWYVSHTGYVLQLASPYYETLTVRENLTLAAQMRLPKSCSMHNKLMRVEQILRETGLISLANTVVGASIGPGLSGGQKRRLCVALQLLNMPSLIFLDEPTSGLDSLSSLELLTHLNNIAASNRTVILTIHQPRLEIYHMFSQIILLCQGQVAYHGIPDNAYQFFVTAHLNATLNITRLKEMETKNPADMIVDMLASEESRMAILDHYKDTQESQRIKQAINECVAGITDSHGYMYKGSSERPSQFDQVAALEARAKKKSSFGHTIYLPLIFFMYGFLLGSVFPSTGNATFILTGFGVFSCASGLFMFPAIYNYLYQAMEIFSLEYSDGIGHTWQLVFQTFTRFVSISAAPVIIGATAAYILIIPHSQYSIIVFYQIIIFNLVLNQTWIALLICIITALPQYAHRVSPVLSAIAGFAGGFFIPPSQMPRWYSWLFYINPNFYGFSALMRVILPSLSLDCSYESSLECYPTTGEYLLTYFSMDQVNPMLHVLLLLLMSAILLILSWAALFIRHANTSSFVKRIRNRKNKPFVCVSSNEAQIKGDEETQGTNEDEETKPDDEQETEVLTDEPKRVGPRVFDRTTSSTSMLQEGQAHEVWAPGRRKSVNRASFIGHNSLEMRRKSLLQRVNSICVGPPGEEGKVDKKQGKSRVPNKETLELRRMQWSLIEEKNDEGGQISTLSSSVSGSFLTKTPSIIEEEEEEEDSGPESVFLSTSDSFGRPPLLSKTSSVSHTMYSIQEEDTDSESKTVIGNTITEEEEQQTGEEGENQMEEGEEQTGEEEENQEKEGEELAGEETEERKEIAEEDKKSECTVPQVHVPKEDESESITYVPQSLSKRPLQMLVIPAASKRRSDKFVTKLDNSQSPLGRPSNAALRSDLQGLETEI